MGDGGCVSLHWIDTSPHKDAPICLVLHGLTGNASLLPIIKFVGGSHSKYTTNFAHYMVNVISKNRPEKPWRVTVI
jgi:predicted alpha/beta-fold hydrolase